MNRFGKYAVVKKIGEGGFGEVFLARDPVLGRDLAIKTCRQASAEDQQRFLQEAQIAATMRHPNLVILHDFGFEGDVPYFVQEYLDGEDLDRTIKKQAPIPTSRKLEILLNVARGLAHLHGQGVLHRDIKPANIRILENGQVKIMDFGIAKLTSADRQLTQTGMTLGTAGYIAPEHIRGEEVGPGGDIFAFGVMSYELLSYHRPFRADSLSAVLYRIVHEEPPSLLEVWPSCPAELSRVVERCMKKDPEERYHSFDSVVTDLEPLAGIELPDEPTIRATREVAGAVVRDPSMDFEQTTRTRTSFSEALQLFRRVPKRSFWAVVAAGIALLLLLGPWGLPRFLTSPDPKQVADVGALPGSPADDAGPFGEKAPEPAGGEVSSSVASSTPAGAPSLPVGPGSTATVSGTTVPPAAAAGSVLALVASDPSAVAHFEEALRQRVGQIAVFPDLASVRSAGSALVLDLEESMGSSSAYGTTIQSCRVVVSAQHLDLPGRSLLFSTRAEGTGPDCSQARSAPLEEVRDTLLVRLGGGRPASVAATSLITLALELAAPLSSSQLDELQGVLLSMPGVIEVREVDGGRLELTVDREPSRVARDLDGLESVRVEKIGTDSVKIRYLG